MTITSFTKIANAALLYLNRKPLPSNTFPPVGGEKEEVAVASFWDAALEEVCSDHEWVDLTKTVNLPIITATADTLLEFDSNVVFDMTAQIALGLHTVLTIFPQQPWRTEGNYLALENGAVLVKNSVGAYVLPIRAIYLPQTAGTIKDALLFEAIARKLASKMSRALRPDDPSLTNENEAYYEKAKAEARKRTFNRKNGNTKPLFQEELVDWTDGLL